MLRLLSSFHLPCPQYSVFKRLIFYASFQLSKVLVFTQTNWKLNIATTIWYKLSGVGQDPTGLSRGLNEITPKIVHGT